MDKINTGRLRGIAREMAAANAHLQDAFSILTATNGLPDHMNYEIFLEEVLRSTRVFAECIECELQVDNQVGDADKIAEHNSIHQSETDSSSSFFGICLEKVKTYLQ